MIYWIEIIELKNVIIDGYCFIGFLILYIFGEYNFVVVFNGIVEVWLSDSENWKMVK